jgi:hypothetical protein
LISWDYYEYPSIFIASPQFSTGIVGPDVSCGPLQNSTLSMVARGGLAGALHGSVHVPEGIGVANSEGCYVSFGKTMLVSVVEV